jgi:hypothetical protein
MVRKALSNLVSIFTILAILGGLYGFYSSQRDKRVEKTFEFYKTFRDEPLRDEWGKLISRWNESADKVKPLLDERKDEELRELVISIVEHDPDNKRAFSRVTDFFEEFNSCIENSLCDVNSGVALLKVRAREFIGPYGAYIQFLRNKYDNSTIGSGVYKVASMSPESTWKALLR